MMINLSNLEPCTQKTLVEPSDQIFAQLGMNTYDYKDLLSELIDNAIAARRTGVLTEVTIDIYVDSDNRPIEFVISDNASGIVQDRLGVAIAPAGVQSPDSLNEHGLGMKQAVAALGKLKYLATKTSEEPRARLIREFKFGELETFYVDSFGRNTGTEIAITELRPIVVTHAGTITRGLVPYLGARYRRFLRPDHQLLDLRISIKDINEPGNDAYYTWPVEQVKPVYFHPSTRTNHPVIHKHSLEGDGWQAELTFGYTPTTPAEYEELGIEPPDKFKPYYVSLKKQGLDVLLHNRVILFHQLSELEIVAAPHPDYNEMRGEIDLKSGFSTAITKNSIIDDQHFRDCIGQVRAILRGERAGPGGKKKKYLTQRTYPEDIPENLLRDRLVEWLANNPLNRRERINKQYVVEGIEGYIDILADGEAWELKTEQASALDVYQLFMYMDVGRIDKGFLVAKSFSPGANVAAGHIAEAHSKEIVLAPRDQFPINMPPSNQEREVYY